MDSCGEHSDCVVVYNGDECPICRHIEEITFEFG
jgi:hypothetical protein